MIGPASKVQPAQVVSAICTKCGFGGLRLASWQGAGPTALCLPCMLELVEALEPRVLVASVRRRLEEQRGGRL